MYMSVSLYYSITYYIHTHAHTLTKLDISSPINTFAKKTYIHILIPFIWALIVSGATVSLSV